jgi:hypothetical protein
MLVELLQFCGRTCPATTALLSASWTWTRSTTFLDDCLLTVGTDTVCCPDALSSHYRSHQDLPSDDGAAERELDMDALNNATLWKLKAYVDGVLTATTGGATRCCRCIF